MHIFRQSLWSVRDTVTVELSLRVISDHISAVERSFGARIGASGPCTCRLHSHKASGKFQCNVAAFIFRPSLWSVRDTGASSLCECFLTISKQWSGFSEHGSVRRDRAYVVCIATRLVAGCNASWLLSSSGLVTCLSETLASSLSASDFSPYLSSGAVFSSTDRCVGTVHIPAEQLQG